nr:DNRLRE domain-containing protein [Nitrosomonas sp.]
GKNYRFVHFSDEREFLANPDGGNGFYYFGWDNASFSIRDGSGAIVQKRVETWPVSDNLIEFAPSSSGTYFVSVAPGSSGRTIPDYRVIAFEVQPRPISPALVIQPDATQVNDVRFTSIRDLASTAVNDEILTVTDGHSSAIRFDLSEQTAQASYAAIEVFLFATSSATGKVGDIVVDVPGSSLGNTSTFGAVGSIEFLTAITNPVVGSWVTIEITNLYNRWISGETPNSGIILSTSEVVSSPVMSFYSSDYAVDPNLRPRLINE